MSVEHNNPLKQLEVRDIEGILWVYKLGQEEAMRLTLNHLTVNSKGNDELMYESCFWWDDLEERKVTV